jgi:hypothetical protein
MKKSSFFLIIAIASLFIYNNGVAQITILRSIPDLSRSFLGSANMDTDPQQELVYFQFAFTNSKIIIIDGSTGNVDWQSPATISDINIAGQNNDDGNSPFCDVNNDGKMEITFSGNEGGIRKIYIVGLQGTSSVAGNNNSIPNEISLMQNYPNPFNSTTNIEYQIQKNDFVTLKVFNSLGQLVKTLVNGSKQSGEYSVIFDGMNEDGQKVSSGVYFYQLQVGDFISNKKMIQLK